VGSGRRLRKTSHLNKSSLLQEKGTRQQFQIQKGLVPPLSHSVPRGERPGQGTS